MRGFENLGREYEARHFPPTRRLDLHGEGPAVARERALRWIQSFAHEQPGAHLLLVVERGARAGTPPGPVRRTVERLLTELTGALVEWWAPFAAGSLAVRIAAAPRRAAAARPDPTGHADAEGRTPETASAAMPPPHADIPAELLPAAQRIAELRREREGLSVGLLDVVLRRVWIEAQAVAMEERIDFEPALQRLLAAERAAVLTDDDA